MLKFRDGLPNPNFNHTRVSNAGSGGRALGFTLLEVLGVLAILAILAVAILSATTKSIDAVFSQQESATLQSFATALQNSILRQHYIPDRDDWYKQIAEELGMSSSSVVSNIHNLSAARSRAFMVDPNLLLGPQGATTNNHYLQNLLGSIKPSNGCRAMLLSSLTRSIPDEAIVPANFAAIWNTPDGTLPPVGLTGWNADDLKIQRINLAPLFVNLVLTNPYSNVQGFYAVDPLPNQTNVALNAYFLRGTALRLYDEYSSLQAKMVLNQDGAEFYVDHAWRNVPYPPLNVQTNYPVAALAQTMTAAQIMFAASPNNLNGTATPSYVLASLTNFMSAYTIYATNPLAQGLALSAQNNLQNALIGLANNPVQGGCTNN